MVWYQRFRGSCCPHLHWVVTPCSVVTGYQRFRSPCCRHLHWVVTPYNVVVGYRSFRSPCCHHLHWVVTLRNVVVGYQRFRGPGSSPPLLPQVAQFANPHFSSTTPDLYIFPLSPTVTSPWRWRHQDTPKRWYSITAPHGVTTRKPQAECYVSIIRLNAVLPFTLVMKSIQVVAEPTEHVV